MNKKSYILPFIFWACAFIILPLLFILYYAMVDKSGVFTMSNIFAIAQAENAKALWESLKLSFFCTLICLVLAYPLALTLSHNTHSNSVIFLFVLPMWMNFLLRTLAWVLLLDKNGVLDSILQIFGLSMIKIINTPSAIVFGMVYDFLPFMILPLYNSLTRIDPDVVNAARDLGATPAQTLYKIIFPLSLPGVISGITMVFVPSLTTFAISTLLGGGKILLIGNVIEQEFLRGTTWNVGSGLSIVLMIFVITCMAFANHFDSEGAGKLV